MSAKPVVVYGASGYTGRLVCEALRNYRVPFIAAGRDAARITDAMAKVPGIETADYEVVAVAHDVAALAKLFKGATVVCNTVGPFDYYGETVVEAAFKAGVHYLDTTGEIAFMTRVKDRFGAGFAAKEKVLAPSTAYMYTPLEIAAHIVLETPGVDTLEAVCSATGTPTYGSTQTIFAMFQVADAAFYLANKARATWPVAQAYEIVVPGLPATQLAHPWGGGTLPLFFESDARVRNCRQLTAFTDRQLMSHVLAMQTKFEAEIKPLPPKQQAQALKVIAEQVQSGMPPRENPLVHRCTDHVEGRGGNTRASCTLYSMMPYLLTGVVEAATANFLVHGRQLEAGFCSACQAVGYRELLGQLRNFGLVEVATS